MTTRGFSAIGLHHPKTPANLGSVLRAAHCFEAAMVAVGGKRWSPQTPMNTFATERHLPLLYADNLKLLIPYDCVPVAVDLIDGAMELQDYKHPERAFYVFGPEDGTLGAEVLSWCHDRVMVPTRGCMNLAAAVNVILYDRLAKQIRKAQVKP